MRYFRNIYIAVSILVCSCSGLQDTGRESHEEGVRIQFRLPGMYDHISGNIQTKAEDELNPLRHINDSVETAPDYAKLINLPVGTTMWLTYSMKNTETGEYSEPDLQAYKIVDNGGYHSMYACSFHEETGEDGLIYKVIDDGMTGMPLILNDGTYRFKMISPALPITHDEEKGWRLPVDNGMCFYATDGRYHETVAKEIVVDSRNLANDGKNVMYVKLNPIINQTARWRFRIFKGENVQSLEMLPAGIEISGLQNPYDISEGEKLDFYWASDDIRDTLKMKMGDKQQWIRIHSEDMWSAQETGPAGVPADALCGEIGFLPTNALSTTVVVLFNMLVNGIPTQYETTVNQMVFLHAHSYNIGVEVDQKNGIRLFNWQNQAWTGDLELYPNN